MLKLSNRMLLRVALGWLVLSAATASGVSAQELPSLSQIEELEVNTILPPVPSYTDGFAFLNQLVDMGEPIEAAHSNDAGQIEQLTSRGLAYWLPETNQVTFLELERQQRWAWTSAGLMSWQGDDLEVPAPPVAPRYSTPREYLYVMYPSLAPTLDRIISCESGWSPSARNPVGTASGLGQFLNTTWAGTPQGRAGQSVFDPYANIDGMVWLYGQQGAWPWLASNSCHRLLR